MKMKKAFCFLLTFVFALLFASCQSPDEPQPLSPAAPKATIELQNAAEDVNVGVLKPDEIKSEVQKMLYEVFLGPVENYPANSTNTNTSARVSKTTALTYWFTYDYSYNFHNFHGVFVDPAPDAPLNMDILLQLRYMKNTLGPVIPNGIGADVLRTVFTFKSTYGFSAANPYYGDKQTITFDGTFSGLLTGYIALRATAKYYQTWTGIYNNRNSRIVYAAQVNVESWRFNPDGTMTGSINIAFSPFYVKVTCVNSKIAKVIIYKNGQMYSLLEMSMPDIYKLLASYKIPL